MTAQTRTRPEPARPGLDDDAASLRREALGLFGAVLSLVALATGGAEAQEAAPPTVPVTVTAEGCRPMELEVPAGKVTFVITNRSSRALEWEILKGVMVIDERENIAPGFKAKLTTRLEPGVYEIACGLLDNPRGRLVVTGAASAVTPADLAGPIAEYRVGNAAIFSDLDAALDRLKASAGDREAARSAFLEVRALVLATAPIRAEAPSPDVEADLDRLDALLFADAAGDPAAAIAALETDARARAAAQRPLIVPADRLLAGTATLARALAGEIAAPASPSALSALEAKRAAVERVATLFEPLLAKGDPDGARALAAALARLKTALAASGPIGGFADARSLSPEVRSAQVAAAEELADRVSRLPAGLGL